MIEIKLNVGVLGYRLDEKLTKAEVASVRRQVMRMIERAYDKSIEDARAKLREQRTNERAKRTEFKAVKVRSAS